MRRFSFALIAILFCSLATRAGAQSVIDPHTVEFLASPDHDLVLPGGSFAVLRYDMEVYVAGTSAPVRTIDIGKPAPDVNDLIVVDLLSYYNGYRSSVSYQIRIVAIGPNGGGASILSNQFSYPPCTLTVSPATQTFLASGGGNSLTVTPSGTLCTWAAVATVPWITTTSSGVGSGTASYQVAANSTPSVRSGAITIGGATVTITQSAATAPCSYTVAPGSIAAPSAGNTTNVTVTTGQGCGWTASSPVSWATLNTGSGSGSGSVVVTVAPNTGSARSTTLTIAGKAVTISQSAKSCAVSAGPSSMSMAGSGGGSTVNVTAEAGCAWTATKNVDWISLGVVSGSGTANVPFTVKPNAGSTSRTGSITIGGKAVTVTQAGMPLCTYSASATPTTFSKSTGGQGIVTIGTTSTCAWTMQTNVSWITLSRSTGTGAATVDFRVSSSPESRAGSITVGGRTIWITQY